jgi:1-deoxyxylulose-5-phosphate synthase
VAAIAEHRHVPMAQIALAWVLTNPAVAAPIIGATNPRHLTDATAALDTDLTADEITHLTERYTPRVPTGFQ